MYLYHQLLYLFVTNRIATSILLIVAYKSRLYHHHIFRLRCSPFRRACAYIIVVEPSLKELGCGLSMQEFPGIGGVQLTSLQSEATIFFNVVERLMQSWALFVISLGSSAPEAARLETFIIIFIGLSLQLAIFLKIPSCWALRLVIKSNIHNSLSNFNSNQLKLGTGLGMITFPRQHHAAHRFFLRSPNFSISITTESPITNVQGLQLPKVFVHPLVQILQSIPIVLSHSFLSMFLIITYKFGIFFHQQMSESLGYIIFYSSSFNIYALRLTLFLRRAFGLELPFTILLL